MKSQAEPAMDARKEAAESKQLTEEKKPLPRAAPRACWLWSAGVAAVAVAAAAMKCGSAVGAEQWQDVLPGYMPTSLGPNSEAAAPVAVGASVADDAWLPQDAKRDPAVSFRVQFNGARVGEQTLESRTDAWRGLDDMIGALCPQLDKVQARHDNATAAVVCRPEQGARVFLENGERVRSFWDVQDGDTLYVVPQGLEFMYPLLGVGEVILPPLTPPMADKPVRLRQLSESPRVFEVENFITDEEVDAILKHNQGLVKPSEVGFAGWRDSTRTSSTAWDFHSWAARRVRRRSFDLVRMNFDNEMADALQVLRYGTEEWYKPHTDWFDGKAYDGHDPTVNNGTNRFATVFVYLSDVEEGGHTVFPLSKTHEGYNGEQIVQPGTEDTAGYIATADAKWACNTSSTALRSRTVRGGALLFYNQDADSTLDKLSLHGGCPVIRGVKWSANVWLWNRPKPSKDKALDGKPAPDHNGIQLQFSNELDETVNLFWDDGTEQMIYQASIAPGTQQPMTTYHGHRFVLRLASSNETVHEFIAHDRLKGVQHVERIAP